MKKVSIIIPIYNGERYIDKCLYSIFNQTCDNYEIIAIDDNSCDNSYKTLMQYKDKIKLYKIFKHDPGAVRNFGLTKCTGDLIIFLDIDDTINQKLIETINEYDDVEYDINNEDRNIITSTVKDLLEELFQDKDNLSIALINKKSINRDNPINTDDLNIHDSVTTILKPRYEIDRHENIVIDKDKIEIIKVKNYTNLFNNFS